MTIEKFRLQFPALSNKGYFNFGGQGPLPQQSLDKMIASYRQVQMEGPFSIAVNAWVQETMDATKQAIATEVGTTPAKITLTENVTVGCNIAMWGIEWREGDEVLVGDCEHPGIVGTLQELAHRFGITFRFCPIFDTLNEGDPTAVIREHLTPKTRMLVISHLLWNTGQVLPLKDICTVCHEQDVVVMVDAAQSAGSVALDLDDINADFYGFTGHKWSCGPAGVGGLYVSDAGRQQLRPTFIGWRGVDQWPSPIEVTLKDDGSLYEVATSAYPLQAGLTESLKLHQSWGTPAERYAKICEMSAYAWERLGAIAAVSCLKNSPPESGLVSFTVDSPKGHKTLVEILEEKGFCLRTLTYPDCIRACTHYFTTQKEIDDLAIALESIL